MPLSFLLLGDWGRFGDPDQRRVAAGMARVAGRLRARFVVSAGDNFYEDGVTGVDDPLWTQTFERVYTAKALRCPWYAVVGNHDYRGSVDAQIAYSHRSARWRMPNRYYAQSFPIGADRTAEFFFIDTTPFLRIYHPGGSEYTPAAAEQDTEAQLRWLRHALARSEADWKVVVGHHPLRSGSPFHGSAEEVEEQIGPLLHAHGVQLYLCGHEHDLQHLAVDGTDVFVSGAGAEARETGRTAGTQFAAGMLGFAGLTLHANHLEAAFYDAQGRALYRTERGRAPAFARLAS